METESVAPRANPKSRMVVLITLLNLIVLGGLLYKSFGSVLMPSDAGVTLSLINYTPGPMLDVIFEYPGGRLTLPRLNARDQVGHSISKLTNFDATLRFKDEQGHWFKENVPVRAYEGMLLLLAVQPVLMPTFSAGADGKDEMVVHMSPDKIFVVNSYQKPGWDK